MTFVLVRINYHLVEKMRGVITSEIHPHLRLVFVLDSKNDDILRASNNIPNAHITYADVLCTYDVVANSKLYITKDAIKKIEEAYKQ